MRYHVAYFQDCAYAAMVCVVAVDAPSKAEAAEHYVSLARELDPTLAVQPAYGRESIEEIHEPGEDAEDCPLCESTRVDLAADRHITTHRPPQGMLRGRLSRMSCSSGNTAKLLAYENRDRLDRIKKRLNAQERLLVTLTGAVRATMRGKDPVWDQAVVAALQELKDA